MSPIEHASDYSPEEMFDKMHPEMSDELHDKCETVEMWTIAENVKLHKQLEYAKKLLAGTVNPSLYDVYEAEIARIGESK